MARIADDLALDPAITAKILRIANSPMYARQRKTENLKQALMVIGLNATISLALSFSLLKSWQAALDDYQANTEEGRAIIAEAVGAKPEELATAFDGVVYYSLADNKTQLSGDFLNKVVPEVEAAAVKAGLLTKDVDIGQLIDARFMDVAAS